MGRGSGRGNVRPLFQNPQLTCLAELTSQLGSQRPKVRLLKQWADGRVRQMRVLAHMTKLRNLEQRAKGVDGPGGFKMINGYTP